MSTIGGENVNETIESLLHPEANRLIDAALRWPAEKSRDVGKVISFPLTATRRSPFWIPLRFSARIKEVIEYEGEVVISVIKDEWFLLPPLLLLLPPPPPLQLLEEGLDVQ